MAKPLSYWKDLYKRTQDKDSSVRRKAADDLRYALFREPYRSEAWEDLQKLTRDTDHYIRKKAADAIGNVFSGGSDQSKTFKDLQKLASQFWKDLHRLTLDEDIDVRCEAASAIKHIIYYMPDNTQAWQDLCRLTQDENGAVRCNTISAIGCAFSTLPDKTQAWQEIHRRIRDEDKNMRASIAFALCFAFPYLPDKTQAWQDLHKLVHDDYETARTFAAFALRYAFPYLPDKAQAWQDLHRLTQDDHILVRSFAASTLGSAFSSLPDKAQAWQDIHRLTQDYHELVRYNIARIIGDAFSSLPDETQAWQDLHRLTQDEDKKVRIYSYHSLGKASVFKATEAKDINTLKSELDSAINYFEKSSHDSQDPLEHNPAKFCLPFYRTYLAITIQESKEDEINKYLADAKEAVCHSKSKEDLLNAVENLANALKESQRLKQCLKERPFYEVASEFNAYSSYCLKAAEYMVAAENSAPMTIKLMRKCNPLLENRIQTIIAEIQRKAELISPDIARTSRCLSLDNPIKVYQCCMRMASFLRGSCKRFPEGKEKLNYSILADIEKEEDLSVVLEKIELAMAYTVPVVEAERKEILDQLKAIEFNILKLNVSSGSARKDLYEIKTGIQGVQDKIAAQELSIEDLGKILKEKDYAVVERLEKIRDEWLLSVEKMTQNLPLSDDLDITLKEIQSLKQSRKRDILGITGDISSIAGLFISMVGLAYTIKPP